MNAIEQQRMPVEEVVLAYEQRQRLLLVKRAFDYLVAIVLVVVFAPLMALIALLIRLDSPGPALFRQTRIGRFGRPFTIYKFRTMTVGSERGNNEIAQDDPRITRVGRVLRNTSLDELPQLVNVLKGDMSLIGPRPALPDQVERYTPRQKLRLRGLPGVTNLPAVSGRNRLDWEERIELDITYLEHWSPWLDARILWRTVWVVVRQEGVYGADGINRTIRDSSGSQVGTSDQHLQ